MTQKTTALPHFTTNPSWKGRDELGVHVMGTMIQNRAPHLEFTLPNVRNDANALIDTVHRSILREQAERQGNNQSMPEVFYLQLDNVNTNKSKDLMAYLSLLVKRGVFMKVKVNFLMVGHTHENIDQMFSRFSVRLRKEAALTVKALMKIARECFTPSPTCEEVVGQRDWHTWLERHRGNGNDISFNLAFRIKMIEGIAVMHSKQYGGTDSGYRIWLSEACVMLPSVPNVVPQPDKLHPLKPQDYLALCNLQHNLEERLSMDYKDETKEFWDTQVDFQQKVIDGTQLVDIPTTWPAAHNYVAPAGTVPRHACL